MRRFPADCDTGRLCCTRASPPHRRRTERSGTGERWTEGRSKHGHMWNSHAMRFQWTRNCGMWLLSVADPPRLSLALRLQWAGCSAGGTAAAAAATPRQMPVVRSHSTPLRLFSPPHRSDLVRMIVGADGRQEQRGEGDQQQQQQRRRQPIASDHRERADDFRRWRLERMNSGSRSGAMSGRWEGEWTTTAQR